MHVFVRGAAVLRDPRPLNRRIDDALLHPRVATLKHSASQRPVGVVAIPPEAVEQLLGPNPGLLAKRVGEFDGGAVRPVSLRPDARRGHREQLRADIDDPAQESLLVL